MVFSSVIFLFLFLPVVLLGYYALPRRFRNIFLLLASVFFYGWGEPKFVFVMLFSILVNYSIGRFVEGRCKDAPAKLAMFVMAAFNLGIFFVFKYLGFAQVNISHFFGIDLGLPVYALPIGISFYTFQAMSYVIDVYRGDAPAQKNPLDTALYIMCFPQLIAGPIVRYETIAGQLKERTTSLDRFYGGLCRFVVGLAKKVLLANTFATFADQMFELDYVLLPVGNFDAWMGVLAYTLQIYYDFSGYSDMAIGLGRMLGFDFLENFNYPYISGTVTEFWRRWHISLGTWFRDYVYIPMGG
ncbi:MAG: MBOAT family protein, partial [Lachnospiraceae bacterium]|nr:MBOAT family protein [Lachnospiraceae bacterium]